MKRQNAISGFWLLFFLLLGACSSPKTRSGPYQITGTLDFTNSFISMIFEEHSVALVDMYGFVLRDEEWEIPVESQTLGFMQMDEETLHAEYTLQLPVQPTGQFADVDNDGIKDTGVQIFAIAYWPNVYGSPYSEGDDRSRGWVTDFGSVITDPERGDEVNGGILIVWAPDENQSFPTKFGADGELFTTDDPVGSLPMGWSIVNLDKNPFIFSQEEEPVIKLFESEEYAIKDYSSESYTDAFDLLLEFLQNNYAFNGITGKEPNYDFLVETLRPRVMEAEKGRDAEEYFLALRDLTWAFHDGHVGIDGGDIHTSLFRAAIEGGYGFAISELDDGSFVATYLVPEGPAERVGMKLGAILHIWNGKEIEEAIESVQPWALPQSSPWLERYQKTRYLLRATPGDEAEISFTNPGEERRTATLKAIFESDSFSRTSVSFYAPNNLLPVEFRLLDSGVGYIAIYSEADDIQLTIKLFERALQMFTSHDVPGIIIDMRYNGGGTPLGLAGFLYDQEIPLGQAYYFNTISNKFESEGIADRILPNTNQYRFEKIFILVGPACASACEEEAYGFSHVPGAEVVGMYPTAGIFGEVSRGQILMPEGFAMQFPTGRYHLADGSLFLEGTGVKPTIWVPRIFETTSAIEDVILPYAERTMLTPAGSGITPSAEPTLLTKEQTNSVLSTAELLETLAQETYGFSEQSKVPNTFTYTISLRESQTLLWMWSWCATDQSTLDNNLSKIEIQFILNDKDISPDSFLTYPYESSGQMCLAYLMAVKDWDGGQHQAMTKVNYLEPLYNGIYDYPVGQQIFEYNIYIKP